MRKEIRRLKAAFNRGVEWKELDVNPQASMKAPSGVRSVAVKFHDRAMRRLYRAKSGRALLWLFMAHNGLRRGAVIGLEKGSVAAGRLLVEVTRTKAAKAGRSRVSGERFPSTATPSGRYATRRARSSLFIRTPYRTGLRKIRSSPV